MIASHEDIVLTGLPRSGTTLACELLNRAPNVIALDEPIDPRPFAAGGRPGAAPFLQAWFAATRRRLLEDGTAITTQVDGVIRGDRVSQGRRRRSLATLGIVAFDKPLDPDFTLVVKQIGIFVGCLPELVAAFPTFAVVRNPLSVLCSWRTVPFPPREGRLPGAEMLDSDLALHLLSVTNRTERQFVLLDWLFSAFRDALPADHVLRYEDVVAGRPNTFGVLAPAATDAFDPLVSRNSAYRRRDRRRLGARLLERDGAWRHFYSEDDVAAVMRGLTS